MIDVQVKSLHCTICGTILHGLMLGISVYPASPRQVRRLVGAWQRMKNSVCSDDQTGIGRSLGAAHANISDYSHDTFQGAPSFPLRHRLLRQVWNVTWALLASWTPPPLHPWRIFLLRCFGAKVEYGTFIYGSVSIWYPPNLTMKVGATLGRNVDCYCMGPIAVGERAVVSQGAFLCTGTHEFHSPSFQIYAKPIDIGSYAWICADAFVGPGVTVGEGAVLAARGVAFQNLDAWTTYSGNPAQLRGGRTRFLEKGAV